MQGSAPQEEEEHPYELLLTAETKKLGTTDGRTEGMPARLPARPPTCPPARLPPTAGKDVPQLWAPEAGTVRALCSLSFSTWTPRP